MVYAKINGKERGKSEEFINGAFLKKGNSYFIAIYYFDKDLSSGKEKKKIIYWQIVESFIIVVGLEAMSEYYGSFMPSDTWIMIYSVAQWLILNGVYILVGFTVYHACTQSEMNYRVMWKRLPLWVRAGIPGCIILGVILTVLENYYYIGVREQINQGNLNLMEVLVTGFASPYHKVREIIRFLNPGMLVYGCGVLYKMYEKCEN